MRSSLECEQMVKVAIIEPRRVTPLTLLQRSVIGVALLLAMLLLTGCSNLRLAYGQGPTLAYWWLDRYADFDETQKPRARAAVDQWFAWHRRQQLAEDAALLDQIAQEALKDTSGAQVCQWVTVYERKRDLYLTQFAPAVADIAASLGPENLKQIEARFAKVNEKWRDEHVQGDLSEREAEAVKRVLDRAELVYGRLDRAQRQFITQAVRQSPLDPERTFAERLADQREALAVLQQLGQRNLSGPQRQELARSGLLHLAQASDEAQRQLRDRLYRSQCQFTAELHNRTTPEQRRHANERLHGWAQDLRSFLGTP